MIKSGKLKEQAKELERKLGIKKDNSEVSVELPVIRAIVCHDILPSPPEWGRQMQNLKFKYREYYVEIYYEEKFIGYMDCKMADNIKTERDFDRVCYRFTKDFYTMLSNYMSF